MTGQGREERGGGVEAKSKGYLELRVHCKGPIAGLDRIEQIKEVRITTEQEKRGQHRSGQAVAGGRRWAHRSRVRLGRG